MTVAAAAIGAAGLGLIAGAVIGAIGGFFFGLLYCARMALP